MELARDVGLGDRLQPPATASAALWTRGATAPDAQGPRDGRARRPGGAASGVISAGRARPRSRRTRAAAPPRSARTSRSASTSPPGWAARSWTGWSNRCWAGCTRATRTASRCAPRCRSSSRRPARGRSLLERRARPLQAAARRRAAPAARSSWASTAASAGCRSPSPTPAGPPAATSAPARPSASCAGRRTAGSAGSAPTAGDARAPTPSCSPPPRRPPPGCWRPSAPAAAAELAAVEYASHGAGHHGLPPRATWTRSPQGSGFLVPPVDGRTIKAATFSSRKWGWVGDAGPRDLFVLRTSLGRYGEEGDLERDDADLVGLSLRDLRRGGGLPPGRSTSRVTRWNGGLPQYPVGHLDAGRPHPRRGREAARAGGVRRALRRRRHPRVHRERAARGRRVGATATLARGPPADERRIGAMTAAPEQGPQRGQEGQGPQRGHPLHPVVGVPAARRAAGGPHRLRRRGRGAVRAARRQGRHGARHVRRLRAAGRRGRHDLVARGDLRRPPGGVQPLPPHPARPRPGAGVVEHGAAPPGRVQQVAHPGVPRGRGAARLRQRLPLRPLLRVVPAARRGPPPDARRPRQDGARLPRRARQHGRRPSRSATTSGSWPSRPTSCTASST